MFNFPDFVEEISEKLKLMESLDSSYHISPAYTYQITDRHKEVGIESHKEYQLDGGEGGIMSIYKRHGAYEIHHHVKDPEDKTRTISGSMVGDGKPNSKFVGTMYMIGKRIIDSGNTLRIVGNHTNGMFDHYNRIATLLAKRDKRLTISAPKPYDYPGEEAKKYSEITISHIGNKAGLMESFFRIDVMSRNRTNNYGLGFTQDWLVKRDMSFDEIMEDMLNVN